MIGTLRTTRYLPHSLPRAAHDPFAPDEIVEEYRGCSIVVEIVSQTFTKARVTSPDGTPLAELSAATTTEGAIAFGKMAVDRLLEIDDE